MFRVVKSELIKWFSGKMIYISIIVTAMISTLDYLATNFIIKFNPELIPELSQGIANMSSQLYIVKSLVNLTSGGSISIIMIIVVATLISEDYGRGTMKYSLFATTKDKLIAGKILTIGIISSVLMLAALISSSITGVIGYQWQNDSYSILQIFGVFLLSWLTLFAYSCLLIFAVSNISKISGAIGFGIAMDMGIGIVGQIVPDPYKLLIITADFAKVMDMSLSAWVQILFKDVIYIVVFSTLTLIWFRKKEISY